MSLVHRTFHLQPSGLEESWIEMKAMSEKQPNGDTLLYGYFSDISIQKKSEKMISLPGFSLTQIHEALFIVCENGALLYVNDEACRIIGKTRQDLLKIFVPEFDLVWPLPAWSSFWHGLKSSPPSRF